jgi:hypothetical protein
MEEEDARIGKSVPNLVARLRLEIGADRCQVMVPQTHPPAAEAEVDFGAFAASIAGQVMKLYMFCMRLSHSGKAFDVGYANQTQESFLDGHLRAFEAFGGVPDRRMRRRCCSYCCQAASASNYRTLTSPAECSGTMLTWMVVRPGARWCAVSLPPGCSLWCRGSRLMLVKPAGADTSRVSSDVLPVSPRWLPGLA